MPIDQEYEKFQKELFDTFISEAREHLEDIELQLNEWCSNQDDEAIRDVFRRVHSIKGSSGACNLLDFSNSIHRFEDLLKKISDKEIDQSDELISDLYSCMDFLKSGIEEISDSGSSESDKEIPLLLEKYFVDVASTNALPAFEIFDDEDEPVAEAKQPEPVAKKELRSQEDDDNLHILPSEVRVLAEMPTVLFCDDDSDFGLLVEKILKKEGFKMVRAHSGDEGLETFRNQKIDLVIADFLLPGINGIELLEEVRKIDSKVPYILMSGQAKVEDLARFMLQFDACSYLEKPVTVNVLRLAVRQAIRIFYTQSILEEMCAQNFKAYVNCKKLAFKNLTEENRLSLEEEIGQSMSTVVKLVEKLRRSTEFVPQNHGKKAS